MLEWHRDSKNEIRICMSFNTKIQVRSLVNWQGVRCKDVVTSRGDRPQKIIFLLTRRIPELKLMLCSEIKNILTILLLVSYTASGFCVELSSFSEQYCVFCVFCLFLFTRQFHPSSSTCGRFKKIKFLFWPLSIQSL